MSRPIFFIAFNDSGSLFKKVTLTKNLLLLLSVFLSVCIGAFVYLICDYVEIKQEAMDLQKIEAKFSAQSDELLCQRKQIQTFSKDIGALRSKLIVLNEFEKKLRIITNIDDNSENQPSLFNVGGPIPDSIDAEVSLDSTHNPLMRRMHEQIKDLGAISEGSARSFETLYKECEKKRNLLASTPSIRPIEKVGWTSSGFGYRKSPFTGRRTFHNGLDISAKKGQPIIATADGIVKFSGKKRLMGKTVIIDHGHGMLTIYGHANKLMVKKGDRLKRGDSIATVGSTGRTTGPHVHYSIKINGLYVNPAKYIF